MKLVMKFCLILILLSMVDAQKGYPPSDVWKEVSIQLYRTVGSATFAADKLGVKYRHMFTAFQRIKPPRDEYLVTFKAECLDGKLKVCDAVVDWTYIGRVLKHRQCRVADPNISYSGGR